MDNYEKLLEELVELKNFKAATSFCKARIHDQETGNMWLLRLLFVMFLDEMEGDGWDHVLDVCDEVGRRLPLDPDAQFWRGYVMAIVGHDKAAAIPVLKRALTLDPQHPYAHLVLAGYESGPPKIESLKRVLELQPANVCVLKRLAEAERNAGDIQASRLTNQRLIETEPYVELRYGIMNNYTNGVLTGSYWADKYKREAAEQLG